VPTYDDDRSPAVKAFLADLMLLYDKHGLAISHEDGHGGFRIVKDDGTVWPNGFSYRRWINAAADHTDKPE
jgi:hypothetical protein